MIESYKKMLLSSLAQKGGLAKLFNIARHFLSYPQSLYPLTCGINITHRCNFDCEFCCYGFGGRKASIPDMDEETFQRCLRLKVFQHALSLSFGAGEPLLHSELFKFIQQAQRRGKMVSLVTNGSLIDRRLDEFAKNPPNFMWVSHYDKYERLQTQNLELLARRSLPLTLGISKLISKTNIGDVERVITLARELRIRNIFFQQYYFDGSSPANDLIRDNDKDILAYLQDIKKRNRRLRITFPNPVMKAASLNSKTAKKFCYMLYKGFSVEPNGEIQPCCFILDTGQKSYGNIFQDELAHIHNARYLALKKSFYSGDLLETCQQCYVVNLK